MHSYYTLENLPMAVTGPKPARLAVIGNPVSHSASPQLHQSALDALELPLRYVRLQLETGELAAAFSAMQDLGFIGCNITVPHKFEAMRCCTEVSENARLLGAVNTVIFSHGKIIGHNTDGPGFVEAIRECFGLGIADSRIVILGAGGGAGQAIATQCALSHPTELTLVNRDLAKLVPLVEKIRRLSPETMVRSMGFSDSQLAETCHRSQLLVQTTSLGLKATDPAVIHESCFASGLCAYDTIYQPPETPFLHAAKLSGCRTGNGLSLLIHQGAIAFQHWFPGTEPLPYMKKAMIG